MPHLGRPTVILVTLVASVLVVAAYALAAVTRGLRLS